MDDVELALFLAGNEAVEKARKIRPLLGTVSERSTSMGDELGRLSAALDDVGGALLQLASRWHYSLDAPHGSSVDSDGESRRSDSNHRMTEPSSSAKPGRLIPKEGIEAGEFVCIGSCGRLLPIRKFPTAGGSPGGKVRLSECRECRDAREAGRGGTGEAPPWS